MGVGALGEGREEFLLFEEHHHCQHQPKPPAGCQELPGLFFFFWDAPRPVLLCGIIVSINPALHPHGWALPSSPQPHNSLVINIQISSENLPAWNAAMVAARKRTGHQPGLVLDPFSPSHSKNRSSFCDLRALKAPMADRKPSLSSRAEGAGAGSESAGGAAKEGLVEAWLFPAPA